ncbi:MAG: hypothetical protein AAGC60_05205 [Acidobacteriota bacterium]
MQPHSGARRQAGAAYVFDYAGGAWQQLAYLKPPQFLEFEHFAASVAISGETIVVGATGEDSRATGVDGVQDVFASDSGAAYVFRRGPWNNWYQSHYLKASNTGVNDQFGSAVAISGDTIAVGAFAEDSGASLIDGAQDDDFTDGGNQGAVYVFTGFIE